MTNCTLVEANIYVDLIVASLTERIHYVRARFDGADLVELLEWLKQNDEQAKAMGLRLREHYQRHFTDDALIEYTAELLTQYSRAIEFTD
jgi:glycosyltransferase involved in cell wall biosynthesis